MKGYILAIVFSLLIIAALAGRGRKFRGRKSRPKFRKACNRASKVDKEYIIRIDPSATMDEVKEHYDATRSLFMRDNDNMVEPDSFTAAGRGRCRISRRSKFIEINEFKAYTISCASQRTVDAIMKYSIVEEVEESVTVTLDSDALSPIGGRVKRQRNRERCLRRPKCACRRYNIGCPTEAPTTTTTTQAPTTTTQGPTTTTQAPPATTYTPACGADIISCVTRNVNSWGLDRLDDIDDNQLLAEGTGKDVDVYIVDTGVRYTHDEFCGRVEPGISFISGTSSADDDNGHGTHVAGTVAGKTLGVAQDATIIPVKVLAASGSGSTAGIASALGWIREQYSSRGRKTVINMSLGCTCTTNSIDDALAAAINDGIIATVSAGNSNADACGHTPARTSTALTVAASTTSDRRASYSNYGPCVDIYAPAGVAAAYLGTVTNNPTPAEVRTWLINNSLQNQITNNPSGPNDLLQAAGCGRK
ncbi:unnamed protein product [Owenia fusiformis]|uniref:Peptidase S8/S53 domain-containing protein n=1 Tax=Owenia fusiformis TaxID=6347 RepID=A0A8S4PWI8_OWEFU|nr:unnamed protein product [Owenia fusiformis]